MGIDADYSARIQWLAELMLLDPNKSMKKLQREALKYYPLSSKEAIRNWMSCSTAMKAADIANKRSLDNLERNKSGEWVCFDCGCADSESPRECAWCGADIEKSHPNKRGEEFCSANHRSASNAALKRLRDYET